MKKLLAVILSIAAATTVLTSCGNSAPAASKVPSDTLQSSKSVQKKAAPVSSVDKNITAVLTLATWDSNAVTLYNSLDLKGRFKKLYPNVTINIEQSKNDTEYWKEMSIRSLAGELPDIMYNKPFTLSRFKDYLLDLSEFTDVVSHNTLAAGYAVDGKILGIPEKSVSDYVYYWRDMFTEADVNIPKTWSDLLVASKKLEEYFGAKDSDYSAITIGAKDEWTTYPFTEFMPSLVSGNGDNWDAMAEQDAPFAEGTDINKAYRKVYSFFNSGVFGKSPQNVDREQSIKLFASKKASITVAGPWFLSDIAKQNIDTSTLKTFYLPVRDTAADPFYVIAQGDNFIGITNQSKNTELAKEFIKFYFSSAWYPDYIAAISDDSTMKTVPKDKNPVLEAADEAQPSAISVMYNGGGDSFLALQSAVKFDYKKLGTKMFDKGFDLDAEFERLNTEWAAARSVL